MPGTILIVDDDLMTCELIESIFRAEDMEVTAVHDGQSGIDRARTHPPYPS